MAETKSLNYNWTSQAQISRQLACNPLTPWWCVLGDQGGMSEATGSLTQFQRPVWRCQPVDQHSLSGMRVGHEVRLSWQPCDAEKAYLHLPQISEVRQRRMIGVWGAFVSEFRVGESGSFHTGRENTTHLIRHMVMDFGKIWRTVSLENHNYKPLP